MISRRVASPVTPATPPPAPPTRHASHGLRNRLRNAPLAWRLVVALAALCALGAVVASVAVALLVGLPESSRIARAVWRGRPTLPARYASRPPERMPLIAAAMGEDPARLDRLLASRQWAGRMEAYDHWGFSALDWAARTGRVEAIRALIAAGADPNRRDEGFNGWTSLMHALHKNQLAAVRALLAGGADPNATTPGGGTALMIACGEEEVEAVEVLLAAGANPRAVSSGGSSALNNAVAAGNPAVVRALLRAAPDLRLGHGFFDFASIAIARLRGKGEVLALLHHRPPAAPFAPDDPEAPGARP